MAFANDSEQLISYHVPCDWCQTVNLVYFKRNMANATMVCMNPGCGSNVSAALQHVNRTVPVGEAW